LSKYFESGIIDSNDKMFISVGTSLCEDSFRIFFNLFKK